MESQGKAKLKWARDEYVTKALADFDLQATKNAEDVAWAWSPLIQVFQEMALPSDLCRPFLHNEGELAKIMSWIERDTVPCLQQTPCPPLECAMKLFVRQSRGPRATLAAGCELHSTGNRLRVAVSDVLRLMWTSSGPNSTVAEALTVMDEVMLLRENIELKWLFAGLDCVRRQLTPSKRRTARKCTGIPEGRNVCFEGIGILNP